MGITGRRRDVEKERHWRRVIREAAGSGMSIREFCRRQRVKESQFYWWQRRLKQRPEAARATGTRARPVGGAGWKASFALVSEQPGEPSTIGIELVLANGRRLRIGHGVDERTLRTVLAVVERERC
jgi:hypothetical protein